MATVKLDPAKGVQIPNKTTTERNAISSPETGALIWNTTTSAVNQYNGSAWGTVGISEDTTKLPLAGGTMTGNIVMGDDTSIGISDSAERIEFDGAGDIAILGANLGIGTTSADAPLHVEATNASMILSNSGRTQYWRIQNNESTDDLLFNASDASEKLRIQSGGGISFNGDTAAANALDDYEEGTWTPNVYNTGASSGQVTTPGIYTKIGRQVTCSFRVDDGNTGGGGGALKIAGLPFAPSGMPGSGTLGICVVRAGSTGGSTGYRRGITYESGTEFNIMETTAADTATYRYVSAGFSYTAAT